jgi:hypothetical protein
VKKEIIIKMHLPMLGANMKPPFAIVRKARPFACAINLNGIA